MSEDEGMNISEDLQSWFSTISKQTWLDAMKNNHDDVSHTYVELVGEFATSLQASLYKHRENHPTTDKAIQMMNSLKLKIAETVESLFSSTVIDEPAFPEQEDLVCNLFTRVLDIFRHNNRTLDDLYQDLDLNKDGDIGIEELRAELLKYDSSITKEESKAVFDLLDENGDHKISIQELQKHMRLIEEKAKLERIDPLSCIVISQPLDPDKIHGNLAVMLIKGENLRPGSHSVKIKLPGLLEYVTETTDELNPTWNLRADFFLENKTENELPLLVEVVLLNRNKVLGIGSFQWKKAMAVPNEFSLKTQVIIKTSTGLVRGVLNFQVMWTPIHVHVYTEEEKQKIQDLELEVLRHKKEKRAFSVMLTPEQLLSLHQDFDPSGNNPEIPQDHGSQLRELERSKTIIKKTEEKSEKKLEKPSKNEVKANYSYIMKVGPGKAQHNIKKSLPQPASLPNPSKKKTGSKPTV